MRIGQNIVGPGRRTCVIAEAGVNHNGFLDKALRLVDAARDVGADAVKFQVFTPAELSSRSAGPADYQSRKGYQRQLDMLEQLSLTHREFARVKEYCTSLGIDMITTPFSRLDLTASIQLQPAAIKLASTDLNHSPLMRAACESELPLILSTGASTEEEIARAIGWLCMAQAKDRCVLLHCVSSYPTPPEAANLLRIGSLARRFDILVGYSDHTLSEETGALAVAAGACVIEKHLTLDAADEGPDHAISLEPDAMRRYIERIRAAEPLCGNGSLDYATCEAEVRSKSRRSVVARRDIAVGDVFDEEALTAKRPGGGIEPWQLESLVGRRAKVAIPADTPIALEMVE